MNKADNIHIEDEDEDEISSGAPGGVLDSAQRGSNDNLEVDYTTRNLVTNARDSHLKEDVPLHSLSPVGGKELALN